MKEKAYMKVSIFDDESSIASVDCKNQSEAQRVFMLYILMRQIAKDEHISFGDLVSNVYLMARIVEEQAEEILEYDLSELKKFMKGRD